jgi:hypothetical protein
MAPNTSKATSQAKQEMPSWIDCLSKSLILAKFIDPVAPRALASVSGKNVFGLLASLFSDGGQ